MDKAYTKPQEIILLEDEPYLLDLLKKELAILGHHVHDHPSCESALQMVPLKNWSNSMVMTDQSIKGGMNGLDLLAFLEKELGKERPLTIIMTGHNVDGAKEEYSFVDYVLEKPFDFHMLPQIIAESLRQS